MFKAVVRGKCARRSFLAFKYTAFVTQSFSIPTAMHPSVTTRKGEVVPTSQFTPVWPRFGGKKYGLTTSTGLNLALLDRLHRAYSPKRSPSVRGVLWLKCRFEGEKTHTLPTALTHLPCLTDGSRFGKG